MPHAASTSNGASITKRQGSVTSERPPSHTLAHEAAHRMQACYGRSLTRPALHRQMARTLARRYPHELASLQLYPASRRLSELEARYTAKLDPDQVLNLFQRYCG